MESGVHGLVTMMTILDEPILVDFNDREDGEDLD